MESLYLPLLVVLPVLLYALGFLAIYRSASKFEKITFALTIFHAFILIAFPTLFQLAGNLDIEGRAIASVTDSELIKVLIGECVYVFLFVLGFLAVHGWFTRKNYRRGRMDALPERIENNFTSVMIALAWVFYVIPVFASPSGSTSMFVYDPNGAGAFNSLLGWLGAALYVPSLIVCSARLSKPTFLRSGRLGFYAAVVPLIGLLVTGLTLGVRGRVTWIGSLLVVGAYYYQNRKVMIAGIALTVCFLPISTFFGTVYRPLFQTEVYNGASRLDLTRSIADALQDYAQGISSGDLIYLALQSLAERAQGVRNSVVLYRDVERAGFAGYRPILGSLEFPIPRFLWPNKLFPGSISTDERDAAMYLVMEEGHGLTGYMGPILDSAHAYWEGGLAWLLISGICMGGWWALLCRYSGNTGGIIGLTLLLSFLGSFLVDGLFTASVPVYTIILQVWKVLLPVAIIRALFNVRTKGLGLQGWGGGRGSFGRQATAREKSEKTISR